jgi:hypothetical protein
MLHSRRQNGMVSAEDGRHASALKSRAARADGQLVADATLKETMMTPVALPPETVMTPTASSALVFQAPYQRGFDPAELTEILIGPPDLPGGIDYDRWVGLVKPAPREAFADPLDLIDYFDVE